MLAWSDGYPGAIATIASEEAEHVVSYVPEGSRVQVRPGMKVTLRPRAAGSRYRQAKSSRWENRSKKCHAINSVTMPQWGTPVRIQVPDEHSSRARWWTAVRTQEKLGPKLEQPQLAGGGRWRGEGVAVEGLGLLGIAEALLPEGEGVGDEFGDVAGADLAAAELAVVQAAVARGADQRFDAAGAIGIGRAGANRGTLRGRVAAVSSST